jgi:hypothetical protein
MKKNANCKELLTRLSELLLFHLEVHKPSQGQGSGTLLVLFFLFSFWKITET